MINNGNLDSDLLKFNLIIKIKKLHYGVQMSKLTLDAQPPFEQRIYLQTDIVIQLKQKFYLIVNGCGNANNKEKKEVNQHFTPYLTGQEKNQVQSILMKDNTRWISINNGFEDVIYYPGETQIKISQYSILPKGLEVLLQNDGFGQYIAVVGNCQSFAPRINSKKIKGQLLQFNTSQENFNLGIIFQDNIRLLLNSDLHPIWNGTEIFDL